MKCLVILLTIVELSMGASIITNLSGGRSKDYIDNGQISTANHRCLPMKQGNAVLVDSSGNVWSAWTNIQSCLAFEPELAALQFVCRNYDPTGYLNVHQSDVHFSFWVHDMEVYQGSFGYARYPHSLASDNGPHISYPIIDPTGMPGHMCAQWEQGGWGSSTWDLPVDMSGDIGTLKSVGVKLPSGDLVFVNDNYSNNPLCYYTLSPDLSTTLASGYLASNASPWGIDCNGGICYVFWYHNTDLSVWYRATTDGITWTPATEWELTYPSPYASNVLGFPQMALTDAADPVLVFDIADGDDITYPFSSKVYVSTASGGTPVDVSNEVYSVWSYPTIASGGGTIVVLMQVATDTTLLDSFARHDVFFRASTDGGLTWFEPVNLTADVIERPGLPQCAKRLNFTNGNSTDAILFYFYGVNQVNDHDPYWTAKYGFGHIPHAWYVGSYAVPTGITEDDRTRTPQSTRLEVYPNPFNTTTNIRFTMQDSGCMMQNSGLNIYDVAGSLVKCFNPESGFLYHESSVRWCGDNNSGRPAPAGVYFVEISNADVTLVRKIIRVE